jgi:hypothetical protein
MGIFHRIKRTIKGCKQTPEALNLWQDFVHALGKVDTTLDAACTPNDEQTRAEGYRHLARMVAEGVRTLVEHPDTQHPCISEKPFYAGDTSDARYFDARIDGSQSYRIEGYRGTAPLIEFSVYDGKPGVDKNSKPLACIMEDELVVNDDQTYTLVLSPEQHAGNWIKTGPEIKYLFIRQYAHNWQKTRKASFNIHNMDNHPQVTELRIDTMRERLMAVSRFVSAIAEQWTKRPMDNMTVEADSPQDEELPLVKYTAYCDLQKYAFPADYQSFTNSLVKDFTPASRGFWEWKQYMLFVCQKAAFIMGRNRLLLRNHANMARLECFLDLFPNAKFLHIKRNPYRLVPSLLNLHRQIISKYTLQEYTEEQLQDFTFYQYKTFTEGFVRGRHLINPDNYIEIAYENLVKDPIDTLRKVYQKLDLRPFAEVEPAFQRYLESVSSYQTNSYQEDKVLRERIKSELGVAFDCFGYPVD